ncbi:hypothetical protein Csa_008661 [Cucumis sativus]|nr:hypothetical protein Csa_008661 [Cucumis sativus]
MDLRKCLGMVLIWVACLLVSMATEAEAQSYGSSDAPEALHSHSMLFNSCFIMRVVVLTVFESADDIEVISICFTVLG